MTTLGGVRIVQAFTQTDGGPVDHAVDVAVGLAARGYDSHIMGPASGLTARAERAGVTWHRLSMTSKRDLRGAREATAQLFGLRPDVLHLHDRRAGWWGRALARSLRHTAVVYTLHGVADGLSDLVAGNALAAPRRRRDRLYYLHGERLVSRWAGCRIVTPSAAVARYAVESVGLPAGLVDVVPNGVDAVRFAPAPARTGSDADPLVLAWVGGLVPVKRVDVVLDAVAAVPGVRLLVAGGGPLADVVRRRLADSADLAHLAGRVDLLGHVADPTSVFAAADAYVLTSAAENCPMALLQAMASGLPVVASAVGGVPEVVRAGVDGLLCPPGQVDAFAEAIGRLADRPDERARMGDSARRRILEGYTLDHCLDGLLATYRKAGACAS